MTAPAWPGETLEQLICAEGVRLREVWEEAVIMVERAAKNRTSTEYSEARANADEAARNWFTHRSGIIRRNGETIKPKCATCNTYRRLPK